MPACTLRERFRRTWDEWFLVGLAHRLPRSLAYRSFIDSGVRYMDTNAIVPEVPFVDILANFTNEAKR